MTAIDPRRPDWWSDLYDSTHDDTLAALDQSGSASDQSGQCSPDRPDNSPRWWERRPGGTHIPGGGRLPDWRKGQTIDLSPDATDPDDRTVESSPDRPDPGMAEEIPAVEMDGTCQICGMHDPVELVDGVHRSCIEWEQMQRPADVELRPPRRAWAAAVRSDDGPLTPRALLFNGSAAGAGYLLAIEPTLARILPLAERSPVGMFGLGLAVGGAFAAWKLAGCRAVAEILPAPRVSRLVLTVLAAEFTRRLAPYPVAWLALNGTPWGLGPSAVSLLLTAGGMCGGLWWLTVPRTRGWWWPIRWIARIPFASALLATAMYAPGVTY